MLGDGVVVRCVGGMYVGGVCGTVRPVGTVRIEGEVRCVGGSRIDFPVRLVGTMRVGG